VAIDIELIKVSGSPISRISFLPCRIGLKMAKINESLTTLLLSSCCTSEANYSRLERIAKKI
jgi:hypothetical protein